MATIPRKPNTTKHLAIITGVSSHEPKVTESNYNEEIIVALNWYSNQDINNIKKYLIAYTHHINKKEYLYAIEKASDVEISTIGALGRLILRKEYISDKHIQVLNDNLAALHTKYKKPINIKEEVNIEKVKDKVTTHGANIDSEIDGFIINKQSDFSIKAYLEQNNINSSDAKKIGLLYISTLKELELCDTDSELRSGYSNFSILELRKYREFIRNIINVCNQHAETTKVRRTVRVVKPKSPITLTAKTQYLKEFPELNLKSVPVTKLVDSTEIWVYNTVTRKVTVYYSTDAGRMTVKGTTILNYDVIKSVTKTLRKPEEAFKSLVNYNKRTLNNWFKGLTTKPIVASTGRMNSDNIILSAF